MNVKIHLFSIRLCVLNRTTVQQKMRCCLSTFIALNSRLWLDIISYNMNKIFPKYCSNVVNNFLKHYLSYNLNNIYSKYSSMLRMIFSKILNRFFLGTEASKIIVCIEKCFKQKLCKIKFPTKNSIGLCVYLSQE